MSKTKTIKKLVRSSPLATDLRELRNNPPRFPRPHRPRPMSELSWPQRVRRVSGLLALVGAGAMGVSAATASSDWNVKSDDYLSS